MPTHLTPLTFSRTLPHFSRSHTHSHTSHVLTPLTFSHTLPHLSRSHASHVLTLPRGKSSPMRTIRAVRTARATEIPSHGDL